MHQKDVFFSREYGELYVKLEHAELKVFDFSCEYGNVYYQFLKREIPFQIDGKRYYDAMTPYGYGGPVIIHAENGKKEELLKEYQSALDSFLHENRIICEFVRFHPIRKNAEDFSGMYPLWNRRKAVCTDCSSADPVECEFHPDTRRRIRKALKDGMTAAVFTRPDMEQMERFVACYYENMRRIGAGRYYYFDEAYFQNMNKNLNDRLILVFAYRGNETIGADLGFCDENLYTRHLSGVTDLGSRLGAGRVMAAAQVRWAAEHEYKYVFHGCGMTQDEDDPLLTYKKFFTKGAFFQYYLGKRIADPAVYCKACALSGKTDDGLFFPAYRRP